MISCMLTHLLADLELQTLKTLMYWKETMIVGYPLAPNICGMFADKPLAVFDQEPGEQPLNHVHRYLQTITAWVNVCRELSKSHSKQGVPLHLYQLNSQFSINITQKKSLDLKAQYAKVLTTAHQDDQTYQIALAAITRAISCAGSAKYLPHIHAEAAIMALAYASLEGKDADIPGLQDASVIFSVSPHYAIRQHPLLIDYRLQIYL